MGRLQVKSSILLCWALTLMYSAAQQEYFIQPQNSTWSDARKYCQACFKELVTLTPDNIQDIARKIKSDHWIGLRKNFNFNNNSINNLTSTAASYTASYFTTQYINSNFTSNDTSSPIFNWTQWANGDPLAFQNWYPGWPLPKPIPKPPQKTLCCSCSCTCPAKTTTPATTPATTLAATPATTLAATPATTPNTTSFTNIPGNLTSNATSFTDLTGNTADITPQMNFTSVTNQTRTTQRTTPSFTTSAPWTTTEMPVEAACVRSPMVVPEVPKVVNSNSNNYIEDSCVAMLSFGPWIEKSCLDLLPFICYEDRFIGQVNITNITSERANLTWSPAPGNISRYRIEVAAKNATSNIGLVKNITDLTYELINLTAGTLYSVQVFPVKCERDLNPENGSFYTTPNKVTNLTVTAVAESSVNLSWNKPNGNLDFYNLIYGIGQLNLNMTVDLTAQTTVINSLIPGNLYNFTILAGVSDMSKWSDKACVSAYTKPGKVYNLTVVNNTHNSFVVTWDQPKGNFTDILVVVQNMTAAVLFNSTTQTSPVTITQLPPGTQLQIFVTVRLSETMKGENQSTSSFTTPGPIFNLTLTTTESSLDANWSTPVGSYSSFTAQLFLNGSLVDNITQQKDSVSFGGLQNAANYTVKVFAVSGAFTGPPANAFKFTLPSIPGSVTVTDSQYNSITFTWAPPANTASPTYNVTLTSDFWSQRWSVETSMTSYTFSSLTSGTRYHFEVRTVADRRQSNPAYLENYTKQDMREVSLSMLCSSATPLLCDQPSMRDSVFNQLQTYFSNLLGNNTLWELKKTFK